MWIDSEFTNLAGEIYNDKKTIGNKLMHGTRQSRKQDSIRIRMMDGKQNKHEIA